MLLNPFIGASAVGSAGITYFFSERFEGTGYQNSWTEAGTGTMDEDYTGVVLEGTQSMRMAMSANNGTTIATLASDQPELWIYFKFRLITATSNTRNILTLRDSTTAPAYAISLVTDNGLQVGAATTGSVTADKMTIGTDYHVWGHYLKGTGANAVGSVGFGTSGTEVTGGNAFRSTTTGNATADAHDIRLGQAASTTYEFIIDQILMSTTGTIGDSPA